MAKGYWISLYRNVSDPARLAEYAALAGPAIHAGGGRILARGLPAHTFEGVSDQRTVIIEFDSVEQAIATYNSPQYQAAFARFVGAAERDVRIIEAVG